LLLRDQLPHNRQSSNAGVLEGNISGIVYFLA